mmetsp:Transcript_41907/g.40236  ORF Transcript_41907/g.40236 Transcript_41907/m.40236 type:complete len:154 (-) Transcript_41907:674-1135(-)
MGSDSATTTISIPSYFISKKDGDKIKKAIKEDRKAVYAKATLEMSHPDNRVEYEIFFSTILDIPKDMVYDLGSHERAFGADAFLIPRILTYSCFEKGCTDTELTRNCVSNGRYCAYAPKEIPELFSEVRGRELLIESLRSRCVYNSIYDTYGE